MARFFPSLFIKKKSFSSIKMSFRKFSKNILLLAAMLSFLAAGLILVFDKSQLTDNSQKNYGLAVQKRVNDAIKNAVSSQEELISNFQKSKKISFTSLNLQPKYPLYLFEEKKLIYWSDHRYVPDYESITGMFECGLLANKRHINVVRKQNFYHDSKKYELVSLIPVFIQYERENDYLVSDFNSEIFGTSPVTIQNKPGKVAFLNINDAKDRFLFSVVPPRTNILQSLELNSSSLLLFALGLILIGIYAFLAMPNWVKRGSFELSLLFISIYLVIVRWFMLANNFPNTFIDTNLFNPKFFGLDDLSPSLGDLLFNFLALTTVIFFIVRYFYKSRLFKWLIKANAFTKSVISILCILCTTGVTLLSSKALSTIFEKSSYFLDFSFSSNFGVLNFATIIFFVLLALSYFLLIHLFASVFGRFHKNTKSGFFHWIYGVLLSIFMVVLLGEFDWVLLLPLLYFWIIFQAKLPKFLYGLKYQTSIYLFLGAFLFSLVSLNTLTKENLKKTLHEKEIFGGQYLAENDILGEGLLSKAIDKIKNDNEIWQNIRRKELANESVRSLVKDRHLDIYFDKYEVEVLTFDSLGNSLSTTEKQFVFEIFEKDYKQVRYKTSNPNIFFVNETGKEFIKQYIVFIEPIFADQRIILILKLSNEIDRSVYPELLMEKKFAQNPEYKNYSYAIYDEQNKLVFVNGKFNYSKYIKKGVLQSRALFNNGLAMGGYQHLAVGSPEKRKIIVSSKDNFIKKLLSDFSFIFLTLAILVFMVILLYSFQFGLKKIKMNFSTKIQLYLNAAFLLPFLLLLVVIIGIIRTTLLGIQENFFYENTRNINSSVKLHFQNYVDKKYSKAFLEQEINKLASDTKSDINFYDLRGNLTYSTRPLIYEYHLFSKKINPEAYRLIIEQKESEILVKESLGNLNYRSVYMTVTDNNNRRLGVISVPFFDSSSMLESQLKEVFTTVLSISMGLFIALLIISYFASNKLTRPLKMVANRIKKISLNAQNEEIQWGASDEIGVLTRSYNEMLRKLEISKEALSISEKQTAWREMAKQVAHEIKNPLTPMKLSIQQLQRTLPNLEEKTRGRIEKALSSLTEQIDNISEIANSFSEFAKMPVPKNEVVNLVSIVQKTAYLYAQDKNVEVKVESSENEIYVLADHQLINRVMSNLILNGIQSVPEHRKAIVHIKIERSSKDKFAIIEVKDNGEGVAEELRNKIFMPNFSTKQRGSGIGLAMAKRSIEHLGGNIWFETEAGVGTKFFVDLPLYNLI